MFSKKILRKIYKNINLSNELKINQDLLIINHIKNSLDLKNKSIGIYNSLSREPNLLTLVNDYSCSHFSIPKIINKNKKLMEFVNISNHKKVDHIDIFFIPGLSFDQYGTRLGYGGGYFDRYLESMTSNLKIGICYDQFFTTSVLPKEIYDVSMDIIITSSHIYKINNK